ncbi:hypothetical protein [Telmatospirillum siberiense]|uniref:Uncharacterized protein n=1 Tax=Telmatospirillum siberiense TaxID=382514 RepID=A0A2N3PWR9_9PROT|nr:hypothetical protein [Telmatospirillum siberiense]PKU24840.1 hypothetical protein CWS72_09670 [Telmatospirillum siberiense]
MMTFPLEDGGFTLWYGDIEANLKRLYGASAKDLGYDRHILQQRYYAGESIFAVLAAIDLQLSAPAGI